MISVHTYKFGPYIALLCLALFSTSASATEEYPKAELFGGYQFTSLGGPGGVNANGWNAAVSGNVNRWFGVTADFSGAYKGIGEVNARAHTYTFGPAFTLRNGRVSAFAHVLFGGFHASAGFGGLSIGTSGFAMMTGGGIDVKITPHLSVRPIQGDWILWRTQGFTEKKNARISAGLVFCF